MDEEEVSVRDLEDHRDHIGCYDLDRSYDTYDGTDIFDGKILRECDVYLCDYPFAHMLTERYLYESSEHDSTLPYFRDEIGIGIFALTMMKGDDRDVQK
jgi:hypothetical protein